jgi:hypothetical protein
MGPHWRLLQYVVQLTAPLLPGFGVPNVMCMEKKSGQGQPGVSELWSISNSITYSIRSSIGADIVAGF